jgi:hypothetical protein
MLDGDSKMSDEKTDSEITPFMWIEPEEGICDVYSNFVHMNWTLFDVRVRFGQIVPHPEQQPESAVWAINEWAAVTMPWGQAKALRDMLMDAIKRYEDTNGEITIPKLPI